ncbi:ribose-5-phosphate isomerase [Calidifontibacter indicus]|uniref:Ribose-5-phosphate isomerase B n=1 Tax=Calidifontibacter indicus TaxID=419650 RepID=A0A3D9UUR3_9MICO|nr:ribose-5-phosphate isomerase [Calidifontibacter indicus]REF31690.1 ribose 5-phosphate isomerase B [Calidifontibacter indicus]
MRVHIGGDHAAYEMQRGLVDWLAEQGYDVVDHGPKEYDELDDYPVFVLRAAEAVAAEPGSLGVVLGGSGNGEQMAANKVKGIRAALCYSTELAQLAREHNDAQIISLGGRFHTQEQAQAMVKVFLETPFSGVERHQRRLDMVSTYEQDGTLPAS